MAEGVGGSARGIARLFRSWAEPPSPAGGGGGDGRPSGRQRGSETGDLPADGERTTAAGTDGGSIALIPVEGEEETTCLSVH